jgi:hypothetical protein
MGAPSGNRKPSATRCWADAIRRALARREKTGQGAGLNRLAGALLDRAAEGDLTALRVIGDRLDGRPAQAITAEVTTPPVTISIKNA